MKVLFLSQGKEISDQPGWNDALIQLKSEGEISDFLNIPYFGFAEKYGWEAFYRKVIDLCKKDKYQMVYFHYFHGGKKDSPKSCMETLLKLPERPIIITSCGDGFSDNWMRPDYPEDFKQASRIADITFSTQMGKAADKMIRWGAKNVVFVPNSMCQVRFNAEGINFENHQFDFDVVFVGSKNNRRLFNPISKYWWATQKRDALVKLLVTRYGKRLGLFGNGWEYASSQGPTPFNEQQKTFQRGRVVVGGNPYSYSDYYSSNRVFFEVSSGIPTVELSVPRLGKIFRDKDHIYFARDIKSLIKKVDLLLDSNPDEIYKKASLAAKYIGEKHTQYHRMKFKIDTVKNYIANDFHLINVYFPFFLPEVDLKEESKYALRINK